MTGRFGVGFIGAGSATQAIHLPVVATLGDELKVAHVMDADRRVAEVVADRAGARASTEVSSVLGDPSVDIVVVCSPSRFHAQQVVAAAEAGKRAVLCEKPLAMNRTEAHKVARAARGAGTLVVVGAMHTYDPACTRALADILAHKDLPTSVRSSIYLPSNEEFVDLSTELVTASAEGAAPGEENELATVATRLRNGVLGLAVHDLPLVRRLVPSFGDVTFAKLLDPWGYSFVLSSDIQVVQLTAVMPGQWGPSWTLEAFGPSYELSVEFPPSYVLAGSAIARVRDGSGTRVWQYGENGYQAEWRQLIHALAGESEPTFAIEEVVEDLLYSLKLADAVAEHIISDSES